MAQICGLDYRIPADSSVYFGQNGLSMMLNLRYRAVAKFVPSAVTGRRSLGTPSSLLRGRSSLITPPQADFATVLTRDIPSRKLG
jgi:hypothetical protein